jgi:hypothetical protein
MVSELYVYVMHLQKLGDSEGLKDGVSRHSVVTYTVLHV